MVPLEVEAEDSVLNQSPWTDLSPWTGAPCLRRRSRGTTWVEQDGAKPFPLLSFPSSEIKEREDPPTAGFQASDKAVILSEALRGSIANRSRRACLSEAERLQFH